MRRAARGARKQIIEPDSEVGCWESQTMKNTLTLAAIAVSATSLVLFASDPGPEWPMWGGTADRNMVSSMKGLPVEWDLK